MTGTELKQLRTLIERKKGQRDQIEISLTHSKAAGKYLEGEIERTQEAQDIIRAVAKQTQDELEYRITEPVSLAQAVVYENPYKQVADFRLSGRGSTECHLLFERRGEIIRPFDASGGGPIDVASYGLRLSSLSLNKPPIRPILLLDEPFKFLSAARLPAAGRMLSETSNKLGIQIIMVTHIKELVGSADKIFKVNMDSKGVTHVKDE